MQIIPVIDLLAGQVVRGIAGRRHEYRPIQSSLAPDPAPRAVARAYVEQLGVDHVYVADLDAIGGAEPAWDRYAQIADSGLRLWVGTIPMSTPHAADRAATRGSYGRE